MNRALTRYLPRIARGPLPETPSERFAVGVWPGEGIGPEVIGASLLLLDVIEARTELRFDREIAASPLPGDDVHDAVVRFARRTFDRRGALLCGPVGGSAIYRMRRSLDLYCKLTPIAPLPALRGCGPLAPSATEGADVLMVRENLGGLYQGRCRIETGESGSGRRAEQVFAYDEAQVRAIVEAAAAIAEQRRGQLTVVVKPGGAASVSELWRSVATDLCRDRPLYVRFLEVDNAAYQVIANAHSFDVVVAPNMFGDVLADTATLLLGSRGLSFSANFTVGGNGVYQTGHGAAHDIKGQDLANPLGQIQSLAMMLGESFGLLALAEDVREACEATLADGWRTRDVAQLPGTRVLGTQAFAARVADALDRRLQVGRTASLRSAVPA